MQMQRKKGRKAEKNASRQTGKQARLGNEKVWKTLRKNRPFAASNMIIADKNSIEKTKNCTYDCSKTVNDDELSTHT